MGYYYKCFGDLQEGREMLKLQSKTIKNLLKLYDDVEESCLKNPKEIFYACLHDKLIESAGKGNKKMMLKQYEMSICSYLESKIIDFNLSVAAFLISLFTLIDVNLSNIIAIILIVSVLIIVGICSIKSHMAERKLSEILFVLKEVNAKVSN